VPKEAEYPGADHTLLNTGGPWTVDQAKMAEFAPPLAPRSFQQKRRSIVVFREICKPLHQVSELLAVGHAMSFSLRGMLS
jgi:hypothetical protein